MNGGTTDVERSTRHASHFGEAPLRNAPRDATAISFRSDLRALRADTRAWAVDRDIDGMLQDDLVLAVDELAANSLRHGGGHGELRLWTDEGAVVAEVEDGG